MLGQLFSQNNNNTTVDYNYEKIEFHYLLTSDQLGELKRSGIHLLEYIHPASYIVAVPKLSGNSVLEEYAIKSSKILSPKDKLSSELLSGSIPDHAIAKNQIQCILKYHKTIEEEEVIRICNEKEITISAKNKINNFLEVSIPKEKINEIASQYFVAYLDVIPPPNLADDDRGRAMHRANVLHTNIPTGRKYDGSGINILCRDDGMVGPHIDFKGRINNSFVENISNPGGSHGDGVSGIMAGAGNLRPKNKGMATGAQLYVIDYESGFLDETMQLHIENDVLVTNSSYSNGCNAGYTLVTEIIDQQLFNYPKLMHVFSAGNANQLDCGYGAGDQWGNITGGHKQAKNCMTVANLNADGTIVNSSSRGPAHDGRIKPDIAAFGEGHISTDAENTYQIFGGTSAAAPGIAGVLAQLQQAHKIINNGLVADAALLKAAILNTANDLGQPGPDFKYGWGQINALRAVRIIEENNFIKSTVVPFQSKTNNLTIPVNIKEARIMLYWHDPEASTFSNKALVNNIDLKIIDPQGNTHFPWVLDATNNSINLAMAATTGIDDVNNMEQVFIENPVAGNYTVEIFGKEIPFGQLPYYLVWEFRTDGLELTFPIGGESFEPHSTIPITWDGIPSADNISISVSTDGGNSFEYIAAVPAVKNSFEWVVPQKVSGEVFIKLVNNQTGKTAMNNSPFSIAPFPENLTVLEACPNFIKVGWDAVDFGPNHPNVNYDVYILGDKYMEKIGSTNQLDYLIPTIENNPTNDHWVAVSANAGNYLKSERTMAIHFNEGLFNCIQEHDLSINAIHSPKEGIIFGCGTENLTVKIEIKNNGNQPESNFPVGFQINNDPPIFEIFDQELSAGTIKSFVFSQTINVSGAEEINLKVFTDLNNDSAIFNNEKEVSFSLALYDGAGEPLNYSEDFNTPFLPPPFYAIENPDEDLTWSGREVVGMDGLSTQSMFINNYSYSSIGEEDAFLVVPIDLTEAQLPMLSFDIAYAQYSNNYSDGLRIELSKDCGQSFDEIIFEKHGAELATATDHNQLFLPASGAEWRQEVIPLSNFIGHSIVLKFININGYGNSLFIDNINVEEPQSLPIANLSASALKICEGETITFMDNSIGNNLNYTWNFGNAATPNSFKESGPIEVTFTEKGIYTITLTVYNNAGASSISQIIEVQPPAEPAFIFEINGLQVNFINSSEGADHYYWDFGDGNNSTEYNPVHSFSSPGNYHVSLIAQNICGEFISEKELNILLINSFDQENKNTIKLFPNPADEEVFIANLKQKNVIKILLKNMTGQVINRKIIRQSENIELIPFEVATIGEGIYFLEIIAENESETLKFVVAH